MSFLNWLPSRQSRPQSFRSCRGASAKPRHRARLRLEDLEDRLAPAVFNVNTLADVLNPGPGLVSLRSAIVAANNTPGGNTINLTVPGTYAITLLSLNPGAQNPSNDFDIQATGGNLTIANTSGGLVAVDGGFHSRVFDINVDNVPTPFTVTFRNFTIQNGAASPGDGAGGSGGGIRSIGMASVVLDHMVLTNNFATADGGGIAMENVVNAPWTLTIENGSLIVNNHAQDAGGGVETDGQGKVFVNTGTMIENNTCVNQGAGIWLDNIGTVSANLTMDTVQVMGNIAFTIDGGIGNAGTGTVSINNCTVENNFSGSTGGGFGDENMLGNVTIANSTFIMNYARTNGGGIQAGGAGTMTTISNSVIENNVALGNQNDGTGGGGGIFFSGGTATVTNTHIAGNSAPNGGGIEDAALSLILTHDTLRANHAVGTNGGDPVAAGPGGQGGGLDVPGAVATVSVSNCLFVNNTAVNFTNGFGGGINQAGGTLSITNSQFVANVASFLGGGVFFNGVQLLISASTFTQNNAVNGGSGVFFAGSGTIATGSASSLINDTLFANFTLVDGGALGLAPSLSGASGDLLLLNDTINGNTAGRSGGGIADGSMGILRLQNTIVSGNTAGTMGQDIFAQVPLVDGGGNLLGAPGIPDLTAATDKFGPPNLFPLNAINSGPTAGSATDQQVLLTEFPMPQSLAIGNGVTTGAPTSDERGFPRPALFLTTGVSIGAVEPGFIGEPSVTFVLEADHQIYGRKLDANGNPTGGYFLTAPGQFSAIAVARLEGAGYEVFGIGLSDGQVHAEVFDNAGNGSGFFLVQPGFYYQVQSITVGNDASGLPLLVAVGINNQAAIAQFDPEGNPLGGYTAIKGAAVQSVTLAANASHNPELFAIGSDNQVYYAQFDAAGNPLTGLVLAQPGQVRQIAVGADASGHPELFAIMMSDSQVYALKFDAAGNPLGSYQLVQAGAVKQIAVGMDGPGDPELFVIMLADSQVYALKFDASGNSVGNYVLTQPGQAQSIAVGFDGMDHEELFAVMADNQVYEQFFDANGNSTGAWTLTATGQVLALAAPQGH